MTTTQDALNRAQRRLDVAERAVQLAKHARQHSADRGAGDFLLAIAQAAKSQAEDDWYRWHLQAQADQRSAPESPSGRGAGEG